MDTKLSWFVGALALLNVIAVLEFVRRRKLAENFALLWIAVGAILIRKREAGCVTTPVSVLVVLASFFLSIYMR